MSERPVGLSDRIGRILRWTKVIVLVVLITLLVVLVLQNVDAEAELVFIVPRWSAPTAVVVAGAFLAGVLVALLIVFLRRGYGKG